jgi:AcrR family transcriptional regulator
MVSTPDARGRLPAGRHKLSREFVVRSQRDRLLVAVIEGTAEVGYPALTVTEIAKRAGVSRKTFYQLFTDKEECLLAAYDGILGRFLGDVIAAVQVEGVNWAGQMRLGGEAVLEFAAAHPDDAKVCLVEAWTAGAQAVERYRTALRVLAAFIDAGRGESPFGADVPATMATSVLSGCVVVLSRQMLEGQTDELPALLPSLLYSVLVPYVGRARALEECELARDELAGRGVEAVPLTAAVIS